MPKPALHQYILPILLTFNTSATAQNNAFYVNKTFNMEVQKTPFTNPKSPASRTVTIDCGTLQTGSQGQLIMTPQFIKPFDLPPLRSINKKGNPAAEGSAMLGHIGKMAPPNHQLCVGHSQLYRANQQKLDKPHETKINGKTYKTSVPLTDDRYCPPIAALKLCTTNPEDDKTLSNIYEVSPTTGNVTLNHDNL